MLWSSQARTPQTWCCCTSLAVRSRVPEAGWNLLSQGKQGRATSQEFPSLSGACSCHHPASSTPHHLARNTWSLARGVLNAEKLVWLQKCPAGELQAGLVATRKVHGGSSLPSECQWCQTPAVVVMSSFVRSLLHQGAAVVFFPSLAAFSAHTLTSVLLQNSEQKNRCCQAAASLAVLPLSHRSLWGHSPAQSLTLTPRQRL